VIVIFGAGIVGAKAFSNLHEEKSCWIIDIKPLPINFPDRESIQILTDIKEIDNISSNLIPYRHYFLQGGIEVLYQIFCLQIPELLFASAPIHVMAELLVYSLKNKSPFVSITPIEIADIRFHNQNPPENLNLLKLSPNKIYFSFAKWDERCPDDCIGSPYFCPNFGREKDETVTEFINRACNAQPIGPMIVQLIHFPSTQIIAGLGGILKNTLLTGWNRWFEIIASEFKEKRIIIATSCNCHGVAEEYLLKK
jgi:hypothetical protein